MLSDPRSVCFKIVLNFHLPVLCYGKKREQVGERRSFTFRKKQEYNSAKIQFQEAYDWETAAVMIHSMMEQGETGVASSPNKIANQSLLDLCSVLFLL